MKQILKEVKNNKSESTATNPVSEANVTQNTQQSGSNVNKSIGVHASNIGNLDSENDDFPLRASKMKDLKHPANPVFQNESDVDVTILSNEESDEADYHTYFRLVGKEEVFPDMTHRTTVWVVKKRKFCSSYEMYKESSRFTPLGLLGTARRTEVIIFQQHFIHIKCVCFSSF